VILLACPKCHRQYDVTTLEPGRKVRCACDETIDVVWRGAHQIPLLKCGNCGGAVERKQEHCSFCGHSLLERYRRKTTLCPECLTRIDEDSRHCRSCGVDIRPHGLPAIPDNRACPRCEGALQIRVLEAHEVIECADCEGLWLDSGTFERLKVTAERPAQTTPLPGVEAPRPIPNEMRYIPCLVCNQLMMRRAFSVRGRSSGVIVDLCRGHGIWLDATELGRVLAFVHGQCEENAPMAGVDLEPDAWKRALELEKQPRGSLLERAIDLVRDFLTFEVG
jgi:Zn-finger nucleic acid-binding protein